MDASDLKIKELTDFVAHIQADVTKITELVSTVLIDTKVSSLQSEHNPILPKHISPTISIPSSPIHTNKENSPTLSPNSASQTLLELSSLPTTLNASKIGQKPTPIITQSFSRRQKSVVRKTKSLYTLSHKPPTPAQEPTSDLNDGQPIASLVSRKRRLILADDDEFDLPNTTTAPSRIRSADAEKPQTFPIKESYSPVRTFPSDEDLRKIKNKQREKENLIMAGLEVTGLSGDELVRTYQEQIARLDQQQDKAYQAEREQLIKYLLDEGKYKVENFSNWDITSLRNEAEVLSKRIKAKVISKRIKAEVKKKKTVEQRKIIKHILIQNQWGPRNPITRWRDNVLFDAWSKFKR
ncbi:hypothetical protein R6Q59_007311 [Mikania micrantha]